MLKNFKELKVWEKSYQLSLDIYRVTTKFPDDEKFGLISQIRRATVSIPSNIAEGYGRRTRADYIKFLHIAYGSCCELETQMLISIDLNYLDNEKGSEIMDKIKEVERMLKSLITSLEKPSNPRTLDTLNPLFQNTGRLK